MYSVLVYVHLELEVAAEVEDSISLPSQETSLLSPSKMNEDIQITEVEKPISSQSKEVAQSFFEIPTLIHQLFSHVLHNNRLISTTIFISIPL